MTTESASSKSVQTGSSSGKRGKAKYVVLVGLVLATLLAGQTGLLGFGLAHLRAATFPRDESLLEYVPAIAGGVAIVDPHQVALKELGAEGSAVRQHIERTREDIEKATGIDLAFDVDKLALSPSLVVARGRFNGERLAARLAELSYAPAEHNGVKYLVRAGEDAIAVLNDSILLYGSEGEIRAGIDAESSGTSLARREEVTSRLAHVGWNHPILGVVQLADNKPSLRSILSGSTGPRAVTVGIAMKGGLFARVVIEATSQDAAEELRKLLDEKRGSAEALRSIVGAEAGVPLTEIARRAQLAVEPGTSRLTVQVDVLPAELDALVNVMGKASAPFAAIYKNIRLLQLLTPGP